MNAFIVAHLLGLFAVRAFGFSEPTEVRCVDPHHIPRRLLGFYTLVYCPIFPFSHLAIPFTRMFVVIILVSDKPLELVYIGHCVWRGIQQVERGKSGTLPFSFCMGLLSLASLSVTSRICMKCACLEMFVNQMAVACL